MGNDESSSRRRFLYTTGLVSVLAVTGCLGSEEAAHTGYPNAEERDEPVPESQQNCVSIGGIERNPDDLQTKENVQYQFHPNGYQMCANCRFFCPSDPPNVMGACARVKGRIRASDWCALFQAVDRFKNASQPPQRKPEEGNLTNVSLGDPPTGFDH